MPKNNGGRNIHEKLYGEILVYLSQMLIWSDDSPWTANQDGTEPGWRIAIGHGLMIYTFHLT